jgi:hypothetical protein
MLKISKFKDPRYELSTPLSHIHPSYLFITGKLKSFNTRIHSFYCNNLINITRTSNMSSSNYTSSYPPSSEVDSGIKQFFEEFYKISDTPEPHTLYAEQFTKDAVLVMASKRCEGYDGKAPSFTH